MKKISTFVQILLVFVLLYVSAGSILAENWPIKRNIDLSSGFGDFRANRFHAGIDLRTGGVTGEKVFAPVSGYVYRVKMAYNGYGKGLYLKGDDGFIYVFGHLKDFAEKIDKPTKSEQFANKRYFLDKYFPKDSIRVSEGELIAYSGKTGAGAPHLHFEKRSSENIPVNPLKSGFELKDKVPPTITRVAFKITDEKSLYETGERELVQEVEKVSADKYRLPHPFYINHPTGIKVAAYDMMRADGMKQSVYQLTLKVDGKIYYRSIFDSLNFDMQRLVNLEYDSYQANNDVKNFRRLYEADGNVYFGSGSPDNSGGILSPANLSIGQHKAEIIAEDALGNKSVCQFTIIQGPQGDIYSLDTTIIDDEGTTFSLKPHASFPELKIDSAVVMVNKFKSWGIPDNGTINFDKKSGELKFFLPLHSLNGTLLRLFLYSGGTVIYDNFFNGVLPRGKKLIDFSYKLFEDGLYINLDVEAKLSASGRVELYDGQKLLEIDTLKMINMNRFVAFIPPKENLKRITRIGYLLSLDTADIPFYKESLNIHLVGLEDNQVVSYGDDFKAYFDKETFFKPTFVEIKKINVHNKTSLGMVSNAFELSPEVIDLKKDFKIELKPIAHQRNNEISGMCWLDQKKNRWVWINKSFENNIYTGFSTGGGIFGAVADAEKPEVTALNIRNDMTYRNPDFAVKFILSDTLSGIEDDRSILVRVDNEWLLPEYDPESNEFIGYLKQPLSRGKHHLGIEIRDRAGNVFEQYLNFKYFPR